MPEKKFPLPNVYQGEGAQLSRPEGETHPPTPEPRRRRGLGQVAAPGVKAAGPFEVELCPPPQKTCSNPNPGTCECDLTWK